MSDFGFVYVIKGMQKENTFFKIGSTMKINRVVDLDNYLFSILHPFEIDIKLSHEVIIPCYRPEILEYKIHDKFSTKRVIGEWFALDNEDINSLRDVSLLKDIGANLWGIDKTQDINTINEVKKQRRDKRLCDRDVDILISLINCNESVVKDSTKEY